MYFDQAKFDVRCEWGLPGASQLAVISNVVIIVDILSFSTCVDIATSRGASVFPYPWKDETASTFAESVGAELAGKRGSGHYSLSPTSLLQIRPGTRLVLPSPNGSALSLATGVTPTLAGCLRNCRAVALAALQYGEPITVIPAGERWSDGSLRPAFEDLIGAGAVIHYLEGHLSPEAQAALAAYRGMPPTLEALIKQCSSGRELIERGFERDVELAVEFNMSDCAPILVNNSYVNRGR